ncbi:MAG TPA: hypothetical protein VN207_06560 [Ktedonobacteraceae bacterium]|nr:hypothetical protein [Ktedonobacteraceae bacterium]
MSNFTNPYIFGNPIKDPEMFFGRQELFGDIYGTLTKRGSSNGILLYGQSRMGKTSVLHQMRSHLGGNCLCVFIDLHSLGLNNLSDFLWKLATRISRNLSETYNIDLQNLVRNLIRSPFYANPLRDFEDQFLHPLWYAIGGKHLLLMLDEAGCLQEQKLAEGISYMRSLMQSYEHLTFLFSLIESPEKMQREYSLLFSNMLTKKVSFLDQAATNDLITKPVKGCYQVEPDALARIFHLTSGHPYYVQLLCNLLFNRWQKQQRAYIKLQDVEEVISKCIVNGTMAYQSLWDSSQEDEQAVMAGMAAAMNDANHPVKTGDINQVWEDHCNITIPKGDMTSAIKSLIGQDIISGQDKYKFTVDLQQMWIKENKRLEWVEEEIKPTIQQWMALIPTARVSVYLEAEKKPAHRVRDSRIDNHPNSPIGQTAEVGQSISRESLKLFCSRRRVVISLALLATVGGLLSIVSLESFQKLDLPKPLPLGSTLYIYRNHSNRVWAAEWSYDSKSIASGSMDTTVQVWDAMSGKKHVIYKGHTGAVTAVGWSYDDKHIASGSNDMTIQIWDAMSGKNVLICKGHTDAVNTLAWSPDSKHIASGSSDMTVREWDSSSGQPIYTYTGHIGPVYTVAWSPNGEYIASGGADGTIIVWDTLSKVTLLAYQGHPQFVQSLAWSPDSRYIVTGGGDAIVKVWDVSTGTKLFDYKGHHSNIDAVAWSPNGQSIASGGDDTTVKVWDAIHKHEVVVTYKEHSGWITTVAWSPDSKYIASGGDDRTVRVWKASI